MPPLGRIPSLPPWLEQNAVQQNCPALVRACLHVTPQENQGDSPHTCCGAFAKDFVNKVYTKPVWEVIWRFGVGCHQYANDTQLCLSSLPDSKGFVEVLGHCLEAVRA